MAPHDAVRRRVRTRDVRTNPDSEIAPKTGQAAAHPTQPTRATPDTRADRRAGTAIRTKGGKKHHGKGRATPTPLRHAHAHAGRLGLAGSTRPQIPGHRRASVRPRDRPRQGFF
jgi:hypothetical protein